MSPTTPTPSIFPTNAYIHALTKFEPPPLPISRILVEKNTHFSTEIIDFELQ